MILSKYNQSLRLRSRSVTQQGSGHMYATTTKRSTSPRTRRTATMRPLYSAGGLWTRLTLDLLKTLVLRPIETPGDTSARPPAFCPNPKRKLAADAGLMSSKGTQLCPWKCQNMLTFETLDDLISSSTSAYAISGSARHFHWMLAPAYPISSRAVRPARETRETGRIWI